MIKKILIKNYKVFKDEIVELNEDINIFVGENDSGKSTMLEAISIVTTGKLNGVNLDRQLKANMFNNKIREEYIESLKDTENVKEPPQIIIEAYLDVDDRTITGANNELREDCPGIRVEVSFDETYSNTYKKMLNDGEIFDIPIEFYRVKINYFDSSNVVFRYSPIKGILIDTTRKDYSYVVDRFVTSSISNFLNDQEITDISTAYKKSRHDFQNNELVIQLNENIKNNVKVNNKPVSIDLREENVEDWKRQMSVIVRDIPFENLGFGSQNMIKIELAMKNSDNQANIVMMEEPENNLSFSNMTKLVAKVIESEGKQVFLSTHSSYIANKLNLGRIHLFNEGVITSFDELSDETKNYFKKLPGYNTLRLVLSERVILVEGPSDELILQKAYLDEFGKLPMDDGIDVIVVDSLAFKRYCDIADLLGKKVVIVTDNDGDITNNIFNKYSDYVNKDKFVINYDENEELYTLEVSVLEVNCENGKPSETFKRVISKNDSMVSKSKEEIESFMKSHKSEWALRVFESDERINYPEYIKNAIKEYN